MSNKPPRRNYRWPAGHRVGGWTWRLMGLGLLVVAGIAVLLTRGAHSNDPKTAGEKVSSDGTQLEAPQAPANGIAWRVRRGDLPISLLAPGEIKARESTEIICQIQGEGKIIWIIPEGQLVKAGDKLVELEVNGLKENMVKQQVQVAQAEADFYAAESALEIQKSKNRSDLLVAQNKLELAKLDIDKYNNGDFPQKLRSVEAQIKVTEAEFQRAKDRVEGTRKLLDKGYVNKGELEADNLSLTKAQIDYDKARTDRELFLKYEKLMEVSKRETSVKEAAEDLVRIKASADRELKNKETDLISSKSKLELEQLQLATLKDQEKNSVIFAPQPGMVVYSQDAASRWGGSNSRIEEGAQVRNRQKLIELPDFSSWRVETRVHESMIQQVTVNQGALISIDALAGTLLNGAVSKIGVLPDSSRWFMPDTKEYLVNINLTTTTLPLKPGMSAKTEIMLQQLKNVLFVPLQAVTVVGGKANAWIKGETGPKLTEIAVGLNNDRFVEIRQGLSEGQEVLLSATADAAGDAGVIKRASEKSNNAGNNDQESQGDKGEKQETPKKKKAAEGKEQEADAGPAGDKAAAPDKAHDTPAPLAEKESRKERNS